MIPPTSPSSPLTPFIDLAFVFSFLIMIFVGVLAGRSPQSPLPMALPSGGEFLLAGLGGLAILGAPRGAAQLIKGKPLLAGIFRNIIIEVGVLCGFMATFLTQALWPVIVLGVAGMVAVVQAMRTEGDVPSDRKPTPSP